MSSPSFPERYGRFAVVAGASAGLGAEFARQLAARGLHLVLLARRADALAALAAELRARHGVEVRTEAVDLAAADLVARVRAVTDGLEVGLLVYNAAASAIGPFLDVDAVEHQRVIDVNCRAPVLLAHAFGREMAARKRGGILLMTSMAGTQGAPLISTYGASKAFNLVFAEALWDELGARGVDVLACRAGATRTPAYETSKPKGEVSIMEPPPVVTAALDALGRGPSMIPGLTNRLAAFALTRILSRKAAVRVIGNATRKLYGA